MKITQIIEFNPTTRLAMGESFPFIDMAALPVFDRDISTYKHRTAGGSSSKFRNGDTLVARITPCLENGKGGLVRSLPSNGLGHGSTEFIVMRAHQESDENFVYYLSRLPEFRTFAIQQMTGTSGRQRVNWQSLTDFEIPELDLGSRENVGSTLAALDDKIELNRQMNETLEAMARAIFKDWFVDFGPTRAKMAGHAPYLAPDLWALFPDRLDDEDKPVGWEVSVLGDRVKILDSKRIPLSSRDRKCRQGPYPYHGATGVMDYINDFLFEGVHVLLGEDGSVVKPDGRPFTQYVWGQFWVNNHAHVLRGNGISNEMLLCFFQQTDIAPYVTGAVQPKLNQRNLKAIPFPACSINVAGVFEKVVDPLFEQVRLNSDQSRTLTQTRDLLLPKLMSGEIRLRDAEKAVEAVA